MRRGRTLACCLLIAAEAVLASDDAIHVGGHTWEVKDFSQLQQKLSSEDFASGPYNWYLALHPAREHEAEKWLSVFLHVANAKALPPGWSRRAMFSLSVFNHEEGKAGEIKELDFTFNASFPSRGWKAFVKREQIYSGLLAPNDSLTIRAFVTVSKCGVVEGKYDDDDDEYVFDFEDDRCDEDSGLEEAFRIPLEEATWSRIVGEAAAAAQKELLETKQAEADQKRRAAAAAGDAAGEGVAEARE